MQLVLGQIARHPGDAQLQQLVQQVEAESVGPCTFMSVRRVTVRPLAWAVWAELDIGTAADIEPTDPLEFISRVCSSLGNGTYYFRFSGIKLDDFWSTDSSSVTIHSRLLHGLPLSCTVTKERVVFDLYFDWLNEFIQANCAGSIPIVEVDGDMTTKPFFFILKSFSYMMGLEGQWMFRVQQASNIVEFSKNTDAWASN